MSSTLEQLRAFIAAVETGSFSAASRKLGKAQSSVSELVSALEITWNVTLFNRSGGSTKPTEAALALLLEAEFIVRECHTLNAKADSLSDGAEATVRLGYDKSTIPKSLLNTILNEFAEKFPYVQLELLRAASEDIMHLVRDGRIDIGMIFWLEHSPEGVEFQSAGHVSLIRISGNGHPLSQQALVKRRDLHLHRKIYRTSQSSSQTTEHKDITTNVWYTDSYSTLVDLVKENLGWAFIPKHLVEQDLNDGSIIELLCEDQNINFIDNVDCIWTKTRQLGSAGNWLKQQLSNWPNIEQ